MHMTAENKGEKILLGKWDEEEIDALLKESWSIDNIDDRIDFISARFVDTKYKISTLIGDITEPEVFVINLGALDCFTFLEYIEAMSISRSYAGFRENLRNVRYRSGLIAFKSRNHFFSDWRDFNADLVEDVTSDIAEGKIRTVVKRLNTKEDGTHYLPGIPVVERTITYIAPDEIYEIMDRLHTGDYVGIYSEKDGLDVSHAGIAIIKKDGLYLRHASSANQYKRVIDQDFKNYITDKPGIMVLRPKER